MRMLYKCTRKDCKQVRVIEYPESRTVDLGYSRTERRWYRLDAGRRVEAGYDGTCPCGAQCKSGRIKGYVTDHVCDARCTGATGFNCECQCGGKNHGMAHSVAHNQEAA